MLKGFHPLSKRSSPTFLFFTISRWTEYQPNDWKNQMKNPCPLYIVGSYIFQVLKIFLIKICKILDLLFLVFNISFYISSRYHFSQVLITSLNITWRKRFCHKFLFPFLMDSLTLSPPPPPFNGQNPLSCFIKRYMTKVFCWCFPYFINSLSC